MKLTGQIRYRQQSRLFRSPVLILQVQEEVPIFNRPDFYVDSWRDATVDDVDEDNLEVK